MCLVASVVEVWRVGEPPVLILLGSSGLSPSCTADVHVGAKF